MGGVIYILRHGATKLNNKNDLSQDRIRGWRDVPLVEEGRKEAKAAGIKLKAKGVQAIVTSDLSRAQETAKIIGKILGVKPAVSRGLRPWNLGVFAGKSTKEALPKIADYVRNKPDEAVPEGESFNEFKQRAFAGLADAIEANHGRVLVIVTHHRDERLYEAWEKAGRPEDLSIDLDTFLDKGDPPGGIKELAIGDVEQWEPKTTTANGSATSADGSAKSANSQGELSAPIVKTPAKNLPAQPSASTSAESRAAIPPSPAGKNGPNMQNPSEMPEAPKLSHTQVKYGMAKPGGDKCATCGHYVAKNNCMIVEPPIYPAGWCTRYESKAMEAAESEREVRPPVYADRRHQSNNSSDERPPPSTAAGAMNTEALSHGRAIAGAKALHAVGHITAAERDKHVKASQRFISKRKAFGSWAP